MLLLIKQQIDKPIEQTKTEPQGTLEFELTQSKKTFSFNTPLNTSKEKRLLVVTSFEEKNSVFNKTDENNSFPINTRTMDSRRWLKNINKLKETLELRSQSDIELHVKGIEKRGIRKEIQNSGYRLPSFDHFSSNILARLGRVKSKDLKDMVYRMELTYDEMFDILDIKYITGSTFGYTLPPIYTKMAFSTRC